MYKIPEEIKRRMELMKSEQRRYMSREGEKDEELDALPALPN